MYPDPKLPQTITVDDARTPPPLSEDTAEGTLIISAGYGNRAVRKTVKEHIVDC